jgi:DNA-binding NarL/FixJ family response regulator
VEVSTLGVLVVDDYEPFRRFVRSTLAKRQNLKVIGEASDGLEAVRKTEELKPDLIVLDIGLPTLNGIEVARQVRNLRPECKILFMSQGTSVDVAQEAFNLGALGYVVKTHAGSELLAAVDEVCQGRQFVSKGLPSRNWISTPIAPVSGQFSVEEVLPSSAAKKSKISHCHEVQFYSDDEALLLGLTCFVEAALKAKNPVIVVATESHRTGLFERLLAQGVDGAAAIEQGFYLPMDVDLALSAFMVSGLPDRVRFLSVLGDLISSAAKGADHPRVVAYGEIAPTLWRRGQAEAAILVEHLSDELARTQNVEILCGYVLNSFQREQNHIYERICSEHSAIRSR